MTNIETEDTSTGQRSARQSKKLGESSD
jgi:hypothetical protein